MISITTQRGIIELPCPPADDSTTIMGLCGHRVSLFDPCFRCILDDNLQQFAKIVKPPCMLPDCHDPECRLDHEVQP